MVAFLMVDLLRMESHVFPLDHCHAPSYPESFVNVHHLIEILLSDCARSPNHRHRNAQTCLYLYGMMLMQSSSIDGLGPMEWNG